MSGTIRSDPWIIDSLASEWPSVAVKAQIGSFWHG